ncbi:hypothetical protein [Nocardia neocaledoniensis]|uniref:hypothetical protein n=1 Tax=Nocardia neocaledoniensis TaxID=236511 RepID=UPI0024571C56|nr:hypothetical protein [Nocardia neocaledoniensis]
MSVPNIAGLDLFGGLRELITPSKDHSELDGSDIADIQDQYNTQRDGTRRKANELGFDGEYRPKMVMSTDPFTGSVADLRAKVDKIDLTAVNDLINAWNEIATRNSTSLDEFRKQITRGMSPDVWSGAAAAAAAQTLAAYDTTGKRVTTAAALTKTKLDELRTGLEPTKRLVPFAPEHRSGLDNLGGLFQGRAWRNDDVAQENARVEAVRVLQTVYAPVIHESDDRVPVIPVPKGVDSADPGATDGATRPVSGQPNSTTPDSGQPAANPVATVPASTTPTDDTSTDDTSDDAASTDDDTGTADPTTPQSTDPGATSPTAVAPGSAAPGSGSPGGSPGGAGAPGSAGPSTPAPGGAVPGGGSTAGTSAAGARASGAAAGAAGRAGMAGMGAPGARGGGKDDESTKGVPDYLITQEHGDELTGLDDVPKVVPPVIGAD